MTSGPPVDASPERSTGRSRRRSLVARTLVMLVAAAIWGFGVWRFAEGDAGLLGSAAIALGALTGVLAAGGRFGIWFEGLLAAGAPPAGSGFADAPEEDAEHPEEASDPAEPAAPPTR